MLGTKGELGVTVGAGVALLPVDGVACAGELGVAVGVDVALGAGEFVVTVGAGEDLLPVDGAPGAGGLASSGVEGSRTPGHLPQVI